MQNAKHLQTLANRIVDALPHAEIPTVAALGFKGELPVAVGLNYECASTGFRVAVTSVNGCLLSYTLVHNGAECHSTLREFDRVYQLDADDRFELLNMIQDSAKCVEAGAYRRVVA